MPRKPLAGQLTLSEDPADLIVALNEDIKTAYRELLRLEDERDQRRGELDSHKAKIITDDQGAIRWTRSREKLEPSERIEYFAESDKRQALLSAATREVNKQTKKIIKQVGETIDTAEGTSRVEPMQH